MSKHGYPAAAPVQSAFAPEVEFSAAVRTGMVHKAELDALDGRWPIRCYVWDVSEAGAFVTLSPGVALSDAVKVSFEKITRRARIAWRRGSDARIEFT